MANGRAMTLPDVSRGRSATAQELTPLLQTPDLLPVDGVGPTPVPHLTDRPGSFPCTREPGRSLFLAVSMSAISYQQSI